MAEVDALARTLFEQAKRFYEKAQENSDADARQAYLHASLMLAFCSFEAHLNSIAEDFTVRRDLSVLDQAILKEEEVKLTDGEFVLSGSFKMYRLTDRFEFLYRKFGGTPLDREESWWGELKSAINERNELTHPKQDTRITDEIVKQALTAILKALDVIYRGIYKTPYPAANRQLQSTLNF